LVEEVEFTMAKMKGNTIFEKATEVVEFDDDKPKS